VTVAPPRAWAVVVLLLGVMVPAGIASAALRATGAHATRCEAAGETASVYVATESPELYGIALPSGRREWVTELPHPYSASLSVAVSPCRRRGYVVASTGFGRPSALIPFALDNGKLGRPVPVGFGGAVAISPDGQSAYVANSGDLSGLGAPSGTSVTPVDLATGRPLPQIALPGIPGGLALTPNGAELIVSLEDRAEVVPVSLATRRVGTPIALPQPASGQTLAGPVVIDPSSNVALVGNLAEDLAIPANVINVVDLKTLRAESPIVLGVRTIYTTDLVVAANGRSAFACGPPGVSLLDMNDRTAGTPLPATSQSTAIVLSPDGRTLYVGRASPGDPLVSVPSPAGTPVAPVTSLGTTISAMATTP
jgi:DNA-binding beta-propeller fold protein YncE